MYGSEQVEMVLFGRPQWGGSDGNVRAVIAAHPWGGALEGWWWWRGVR